VRYGHLNQIHMSQPFIYEIRKPPIVPITLKEKTAEKNVGVFRWTESHKQEWKGYVELYSVHPRRNKSLSHCGWRYDAKPEIWNGHNISQFFDMNIDEKFVSLEQEEELTQKWQVYIEMHFQRASYEVPQIDTPDQVKKMISESKAVASRFKEGQLNHYRCRKRIRYDLSAEDSTKSHTKSVTRVRTTNQCFVKKNIAMRERTISSLDVTMYKRNKLFKRLTEKFLTLCQNTFSPEKGRKGN